MAEHHGCSAYRAFEEALIPLVNMQTNGIAIDTDMAHQLDVDLQCDIDTAVSNLHLADMSISGAVLDKLSMSCAGGDDMVRGAIAQAIGSEVGRNLPIGEDGRPRLSQQVLLSDFCDSTVAKAYGAVQKHVRMQDMLRTFVAAADSNGRLHPQTSISTITGRTGSRAPSLQQTPRERRFRQVFKAKSGHKVVSLDYSSIELAIAAALGSRAYSELMNYIQYIRDASGLVGNRSYIKNQSLAYIKKNVDWILTHKPSLKRFLLSHNSSVPQDLQSQLSVCVSARDWAHNAACTLAGHVSKLRLHLQSSGTLPLTQVFVNGVDPHLATAVTMEILSGRVITDLSPLEYIAQHDTSALLGARQSAKAVNFGALYGQGAGGLHVYGKVSYGLNWTADEAGTARDAWFALYPEVGIWHWLCMHAYKNKDSDGNKVYVGKTISGRDVMSYKLTSCINYQDQGTGAEIALNALADVHAIYGDYLVNFVHDEIVLEVPDARVDEVVEKVSTLMLNAANRHLIQYGILLEVKASVGHSWAH
jgi:DNA polymerase-1